MRVSKKKSGQERSVCEIRHAVCGWLLTSIVCLDGLGNLGNIEVVRCWRAQERFTDETGIRPVGAWQLLFARLQDGLLVALHKSRSIILGVVGVAFCSLVVAIRALAVH